MKIGKQLYHSLCLASIKEENDNYKEIEIQSSRDISKMNLLSLGYNSNNYFNQKSGCYIIEPQSSCFIPNNNNSNLSLKNSPSNSLPFINKKKPIPAFEYDNTALIKFLTENIVKPKGNICNQKRAILFIPNTLKIKESKEDNYSQRKYLSPGYNSSGYYSQQDGLI